MNVKKKKCIEAIAITIVFIMVAILQYLQVSTYQGFSVNNPLLLNAFINDINSSLDISHGGEFFYTNILTFICSLFGNTSSILYCFQGILQFSIVFFIFFALRKVFNSVTAVFYVVLFLCIPLNIDLSSEVFVLLNFSFLVWLLCSLFQFCIQQNRSYSEKVILSSLVGFLCGISVGADIIVVVLILVGLLGLLLLKGINAKIVLANGFGAIIGSITVAAIHSAVNGKGFEEVVLEYGRFYFSKVDIIGFQNTIFYDSWNLYYIIGFGIIFLIIYGFGLIYGKKLIAFLFTVTTVTVIIFICFDVGVIDYDRILLVVMSFLFCNGIYGIFYAYRSKEKLDKRLDLSEIKVPIEINAKKAAQGIKVNFIPNPLPVPKKHVKKKLLYGFEPEETQMKFDIELDHTNDDYDMK